MEGPTDGDEPVLCKFKDVGREHILYRGMDLENHAV
ncbi:hypothetical protein FOXG_17831 [Fusarium oxysporum f. sp. lycopersici 4287]|uniref:Uncharacterized protein n=2 Tax=Fusarium oxysporum TaxID=5507 RepID=A0A0J9U4N6_FUSO4|nr:hypothetical protein FOXG_17831 [Fusarium oxysporum f. sp. lycopersici 4287]EXK47530.1 hypothetical protein FOMG_00879 [Fusarium oxysporum f. sp. melonis 26406]KNA93929.1 hypothetical protein FOXG_17831 [Fusarium oxysporum f. sp. lycopersici 4287]